MVTKERAKQEVIFREGQDILENCPHCGEELEHRWQRVDSDHHNPVRWCHFCDIAWIWERDRR